MEFNSHYNADNISFLENKIFKDHLKISKEYNNFNDITFEQKNLISNLSNSFLNLCHNNIRSQYYIDVLKYLSTPLGRERLAATKYDVFRFVPSYDEYLVFVISSLDPECSMFTTYLQCDKKLTKNEKINIVRKKAGFFSEIIFKAEKDYYFKFVNNLLTDVKIDSSSYIDLIASAYKSFDNISQDRFEVISKIADVWNYVVNPESKYTTCSYNLIHQSKLLGLNSLEDRIVFFICAVDPELKLLSIYEDENRTNIMKYRSLLELGFYNPRFIQIEKDFRNKYMPDKKVSEWSK